jgi:hypothetical protein
MKPGGFTTTAVLAPVFSASMKSLSRQIGELKTIVDQANPSLIPQTFSRDKDGVLRLPTALQRAVNNLR